MFDLKKVEPIGHGLLKLEYSLEHSTPGRTGTNLASPLHIMVTPGKTTCKLVIDDCSGANTEEALERLASWCERMAIALRERPENRLSIPFQ
jgi:hypothetical protein